jgi:hypothetical protein
VLKREEKKARGTKMESHIQWFYLLDYLHPFQGLSVCLSAIL